MSNQPDLFGKADIEVAEPEPKTKLQVGRHCVQIPLRKQRREACNRLMDILADLEGKDIYIGSYEAGGRHFWLDNLKLPRLQLEFHPSRFRDDQNYIPGVIVLWGSRGACVRIFTDFLVAIREQEYQGYRHYLLDFRNGFYDWKMDEFKSHYACLTITRFKD